MYRKSVLSVPHPPCMNSMKVPVYEKRAQRQYEFVVFEGVKPRTSSYTSGYGVSRNLGVLPTLVVGVMIRPMLVLIVFGAVLWI